MLLLLAPDRPRRTGHCLGATNLFEPPPPRSGQQTAPSQPQRLARPWPRPGGESNREFDASLRQRNPRWGYRDVAAVAAAALPHGLALRENRAMPANNQLLWFVRQP